MPQINFSNLDFDQIKSNIKDYLRADSNFTDFDYEGSNLSTLIDILAYNTYLNSFNANMIANEVFIDSATLRENVVSLARNIGYIPRSIAAAKAEISFRVDTSSYFVPPSTITLKKGPVVTSTNFGSESYVFCTTEDVTIPVKNNIASFENIPIYEGTFITQTFTVNNSQYNQRYILNNGGIDTSTIKVTVANSLTDPSSNTYNLVDTITKVSSSSKIFLLQEIEDERYEILFGDGVFGKKLENRNIITVTYVVTSGKAANGISVFNFSGKLVDNNGQTISIGIANVITNSSSAGGDNIESTNSIRKYAPRIYSSQNRAVTASDYETLVAKIFPETDAVTAFGGEDLTPPQYGKVFLAIKPRGYNYISDISKRKIIKDLKKYSVAGILPEIIDLKYLFVEVTSSVYYNSNLTKSIEDLKTNVISSLTTFANSSDVNRFGSRLKYSKLLKIIDEVDIAITSNITKIKMRRDLRPAIGVFSDYEICFGNPFHLKYDASGQKTSFNIKSTGFQVNGIAGDIYLSDIPEQNGLTGSIFLFRKTSDFGYEIVKNNAGKVDYSKGEIILNALNIVGTELKTPESIIEIESIPDSNDVIGLQDLFLQIDVNSFNINLIPDTISSESDTSGYSYTRTSSYSNGTISR
ncbi:baseplate wedge protein [bacterium]|nr:baseplate wedge protein [bacterium]